MENSSDTQLGRIVVAVLTAGLLFFVYDGCYSLFVETWHWEHGRVLAFMVPTGFIAYLWASYKLKEPEQSTDW